MEFWPRVMRQGLRRCNLCLVFEDAVIGFQAASNANMACCVVLNGENNQEEFVGMNVRSFIETEQDILDLFINPA
jgi:beta-phosphoglucomutase-like phosphatase (HAD superfamily)